MNDKWEMLIVYKSSMEIFTPVGQNSVSFQNYMEEKTGKRWEADDMYGDFWINKKRVPQWNFVIPYLLAEGWEPYAVHGSDGGSITVHCYRRKINSYSMSTKHE